MKYSDLDYLNQSNTEWDNTESIYRKAVDEKDDETIFKCFHKICSAFVFKKLKRTKMSIDNKQELALDATIYAMDRRNVGKHKKLGGMHYEKLSTWCYYAVKEFLYNPQKKFEDAVDYNEELLWQIK